MLRNSGKNGFDVDGLLTGVAGTGVGVVVTGGRIGSVFGGWFNGVFSDGPASGGSSVSFATFLLFRVCR